MDRLNAEGQRWRRRRLELLGRPDYHRQRVADALGLSLRTVQRYETEGPPAWYELALEGLAARKQKGQPGG